MRVTVRPWSVRFRLTTIDTFILIIERAVEDKAWIGIVFNAVCGHPTGIIYFKGEPLIVFIERGLHVSELFVSNAMKGVNPSNTLILKLILPYKLDGKFRL